MTLTELQFAIKKNMEENGIKQTPVLMALGVCEEAGEMCHAILKHEQRIGICRDEISYRQKLMDAIGDTAIYLMQLCHEMGWDFETIIQDVGIMVLARNAGGYKKIRGEK